MHDLKDGTPTTAFHKGGESEGGASSSSPAPAKWGVTCAEISLFLVVFLAALTLRAWPIPWISVWFDESWTYSSIHKYGFFDYCTRFFSDWENREHLPLNFLLQYLWGKTVSSSNIGLRLLPLALGAAAIPWVWLCGKKFGGAFAGLFAATLHGLSPFFCFHSQGIRMYALMTLLGTISCFAFMRMLETNGKTRWIWPNIICNMLLLLTHISALYLVGVQIMTWAAVRLGTKRLFQVWLVVHLLGALPLCVMESLRFVPDNVDHLGWAGSLALAFVISGFFKDFSETTFYLNWPVDEGVRVLPSYAFQLPFYVLTILMFLFAAALSLAVCAVVLRGRGALLPAFKNGLFLLTKRRPEVLAAGQKLHVYALLLFFAPLAGATVFSALSFPTLATARYTIWSLLAAHWILAFWLASPGRLFLRRGAAVIVVLALASHQVFLLALPSRQNYLGVAEMLQTAVEKNDRVLFVPSHNAESLLISAGRIDYVLNTADDLAEMMQMLGEDAPLPRWLLVDGHGEQKTLSEKSAEVEPFLNDMGVTFRKTIFAGMECVAVYELNPETTD